MNEKAIPIKRAAKQLGLDWQFLLGLIRAGEIDIRLIKGTGRTGRPVWLIRGDDVNHVRDLMARVQS